MEAHEAGDVDGADLVRVVGAAARCRDELGLGPDEISRVISVGFWSDRSLDYYRDARDLGYDDLDEITGMYKRSVDITLAVAHIRHDARVDRDTAVDLAREYLTPEATDWYRSQGVEDHREMIAIGKLVRYEEAVELGRHGLSLADVLCLVTDHDMPARVQESLCRRYGTNGAATVGSVLEMHDRFEQAQYRARADSILAAQIREDRRA